METTTKNTALYEQAASVPESAKKPITAGKLKGFTNINPQYRIKRMTEMFGPCGIGWGYEIKEQRVIPIPELNEQYAFVEIGLWYKLNGEKSELIPGIGGNCFVANTRNGIQASDDAFKCALSDAIGTATRYLGIGGDVYWAEDVTKYGTFEHTPTQASYAAPSPAPAPTQTARPMPAPVEPAPAPAQSTDDPKAFIVPFGKHRGKTLGEVLAVDSQYVKWLGDDADGKFANRFPDLVQACKAIS